LKSGRTPLAKKKITMDFFTRPFDWEYIIEKFKRFTSDVINEYLENKIIETIQDLENQNDVMSLIDLISIKSS